MICRNLVQILVIRLVSIVFILIVSEGPKEFTISSSLNMNMYKTIWFMLLLSTFLSCGSPLCMFLIKYLFVSLSLFRLSELACLFPWKLARPKRTFLHSNLKHPLGLLLPTTDSWQGICSFIYDTSFRSVVQKKVSETEPIFNWTDRIGHIIYHMHIFWKIVTS